jgi:hypothetical protein
MAAGFPPQAAGIFKRLLPECHQRRIFPDENAATGSHRLSRKRAGC